MVMNLLLLRRAARSCHAALDCESHQLGGSSYAKLVAHDRRGVGDGFVGGMDQPRDLGEALARAEQAQDLHLARGQLGKRISRKGRFRECKTSRHRRRQINPALCDFMDRLDQVLGISSLGNVTLGADLDGARGEYRIIVHAEHDDTRRRVAREETPRQLETGNRRKVDVEDADIGMPFAELALATLRVGGFQYVDLGVVREQGTAARSNDAMIINNQNAHWYWSRTPLH